MKTEDSLKVDTSSKQSNTSQSSSKGKKVVICYEWNLDDNNKSSSFGAFVRVGLVCGQQKIVENN